MLNKYMFWLVIGFAVFVFWKIYSSRADNRLKRDQSKRHHSESSDEAASSQKNLAQDVEQCAWCGVYLPRSEGFSHKGSGNADPMWCSVEHLQQGIKLKSRWWRR